MGSDLVLVKQGDVRARVQPPPRLGLAQLHEARGGIQRLGGVHDRVCVCVSDSDSSARRRLRSRRIGRWQGRR